ncbi:hypothetical protein [Pseudoalteromonas luteoviolacea]|uniref:Uncharacterized protein n=1 Tax=Pseudoalteromonas luteoviolacea S4060-1 TaxID=1365257 RepID=A0A167K6D1_9GAMM|nr:hypothetical protein [Pseudoalteromonas luteoviolacea]KZN31000.1 hypothetical protein N480_03310 [Pseudoalteromonas luteoviolacea S2607]KZN62195.1 hypothetical protein N478_25625 [Pseudoalteromonas luteoviolacea S4060-1]
MKRYTLMAVVGLGLVSASASAQDLVVECLISGTPTQQTLTPHFCYSQTNVPDSGVYFKLKSSKPVADVTWSYGGSSGSWRCNGNSSCFYTAARRVTAGSVEACVTRVLYTDGTWENANACATGEFWYSGGGPNPLDHEEVE